MLKKIISVILGLLTASLCYAQTDAKNPFEPKENLYVGLGLGGMFVHNNFTRERVYTSVSDGYTNHVDQLAGNFYLGYGYTWANNVFWGLEANTYFPNIISKFKTPRRITDSSDFMYYQYVFKDYLGLDLLLGQRFSQNSLLYGRLGLSFRDVILQGFINNEGTSMGGRFGFGTAHQLSEHIGVAMDYIYTYFPTWGSHLGHVQYNLKSYENYVGISLIYST